LVLHVVHEFLILCRSHKREFLGVSAVITQRDILCESFWEAVLRVVDLTRHTINRLIVQNLVIEILLIELPLLKDQSLDLSNRHVVKKLSGLGVADGLLKSRVELLDLHFVSGADLVLDQLIYLLLHLVIGDLFVVLEEELLIVCLVILLLLLSVRFLRAPLFLVVVVPLE
jgi:hypothetical protein